MGIDTHMIAGSRACSTSSPAHSPDHHQPVKPALCRGPAWDPPLTEAMLEVGVKVEEERVLGDLLADLAG
jgi:hypothetical protein